MAERKKRGLGRGLGALIPDAAASDRPVDVFFSGGEAEEAKESIEEPKAPRTARTDPAASMQSSRRRKPKAGASTDASTEKSAKKDAPAAKASSSAKKTTGTAAVNSGASGSTAQKAAAGTKSTGTKTTGTKTTGAKTTGAKTDGQTSTTTKTSAGKTATTSANSAKAGAAGKASAAKPSGAKSTSVESSAAAQADKQSSAKKAATEPSIYAPPTKTNPATKSTKSTTESGFGSVSPSTSGDTTAESDYNATVGSAAPVYESAEPDVEANSEDMTKGVADVESVQAGDVSEMHPGVYRSGHETFDQAQEATAEYSVTTEVVSEQPDSTGSDTAPDAAGGDDDSASNGDTGVTGVDSIPDTEFGEIDVDRIDANPRQPRTFFDEDQLGELVHSIREIGVLQPVVVRQKPGDTDRFELIMGERRLRATKDAGLFTIPAIIRYVDDTDLLRDALLENLHRAELNPLEEAAAYGQLLEDFGCTQEELSERIGRSRPQISNTLRLLRLPPLVQRRVAAGVISAGHARAILGLRDPEHMEVLAQRIVAEGMSVRASEEAVVLLNRGDSMNVSRAATRVSPQFIEVAERLGDRLDTKVNISVGKKKGKLSVEFANQDDLDRILNLLGVESPAE